MIKFNPNKHFIGDTCRNGHTHGIKYISTRGCVECNHNRGRDWYFENHEKAKKGAREKAREKRKIDFSHREAVRKYRLKYPERVLERNSRYRSSKIRAIPRWYQPDLCCKVYEKARDWNSHVDHVVPINSKIVCGLHCWENLQILPEGENVRKGNQIWPDMP